MVMHRRTSSDTSVTTSGRSFAQAWNNVVRNGEQKRASGSRPQVKHGHARTFSNMSDAFMSSNNLFGKVSFWAIYFVALVGTWLLLCVFTDPGMALTWLNILHAVVTFPLLHWFRIQKFDMQNIYDSDLGGGEPQTYWEQIDHGKQWTRTRKGLLILPVVLYLVATNTADFTRQPLLLNLLAMLVLVIPKLRGVVDK